MKLSITFLFVLLASLIQANSVLDRVMLSSTAEQSLEVYDRHLLHEDYNCNGDVLVRLHFDDSHLQYFNTNWQVNLDFDITLWDNTNTSSTLSSQSLSIAFNPDASATATTDVFRIYKNFTKASITTSSISFSGISALPEGVWLELEYISHSYRTLALSAATPILTQSIEDNGYLLIGWQHILGSRGYDLEWLFVDRGLGDNDNQEVELDWRNATRIHTRFNSYMVPLQFPRGELFFRVRYFAPQSEDREDILPSVWSIDFNTFSYVLGSGIIPGVSSELAGQYHLNLGEGFQPNMSWQFSAAYAEDGLRSEQAVFFDDMLRPIQSVAVLQSKQTAVLSENVYDAMGREAISFLPHPSEEFLGASFYPDELLENNPNDDNSFYDYHDFDAVGTYDTPILPDNSVGAAKYFSQNNTTEQVNGQYVPDANGYVFARTKFKNDGTGRVLSQSGVGEQFSETSNHKTHYLYGAPTQEELDRLFGSEASKANTYYKTVVVDPNGQASVAYFDGFGRTVATALAGSTPPINNCPSGDCLGEDANMFYSLDQPSTSITSDLSVFNSIQEDRSILEYTFIVETPSNRSFTYSLEEAENCFTDDGSLGCYPTQKAICYDTCMYDLHIMAENTETGQQVPITLTTSNLPAPNSGAPGEILLVNIPNALSITFELTGLTVGSYRIIKTTTLNQDQVNADLQDIISEQQQILTSVLNTIIGSSTLGASSLLGIDQSSLDLPSNAAFSLPFFYEDCQNCFSECIENHLLIDECGNFNWYYYVISEEHPEGEFMQWPIANSPTIAGGDTPVADLIANLYASIPASIVSAEPTGTASVISLIETGLNACVSSCSEDGIINAVASSEAADQCQAIYQKMIDDLSPGGYYFEAVTITGADWMQTYAPDVNTFGLELSGTEPSSGWTWMDAKEQWQSQWAEQIITIHPDFCTWSFYCDNYNYKNVADPPTSENVISAAPFSQYSQEIAAQYNALLSSNSDYNIWRPITLSTQNNPANAKYLPNSFTGDIEDLFWKGLNQQTQATADQYYGYLKNQLLYSFAKSSSATVLNTDYVSIYWMLDINLHATITENSSIGDVEEHLNDILGQGNYSSDFRDLFIEFHGGNINPDEPENSHPGLLGYGENQVAPEIIFLGYYNFWREYFAYYLIQNTYYSFLHTHVLPSDNYLYTAACTDCETPPFHPTDPSDGEISYSFANQFSMATMLNGAPTSYPKNDIFEALGSPEVNDFPLTSINTSNLLSSLYDNPDSDAPSQFQLASELYCQSRVENYFNQHPQCVSSLSQAQITQLKDLLQEICIATCSSEYPTGNDNFVQVFNNINGYYYAAANQYFTSYDLLIGYFTGTTITSECSFQHPAEGQDPFDENTSGYNPVECACDKIQEYIQLYNQDANNPSVSQQTSNWNTTDWNNFITWISAIFNDSDLALLEASVYDNNNDLIPDPSLLAIWNNTCGSIPTIENLPANMSAYFGFLPSALACGNYDEYGLSDMFPEISCEENLNAEAVSFYQQAVVDVNNQLSQLQDLFIQNTNQNCIASLDQRESMSMTYSLKEYYYTLYFYDRAGNLLKTVPPEGVHPLRTELSIDNNPITLEQEIANSSTQPFIGTYDPQNPPSKFLSVFDVAAHRQDPNAHPFVSTDFINFESTSGAVPLEELKVHQLQTYYKYNSYNQLYQQETPDGGVSLFWYDHLGRIVLSQNANQKNHDPQQFSYTIFDQLARPSEAGELTLKDFATLSNLPSLLPDPGPGLEAFDMSSYNGIYILCKNLQDNNFNDFISFYFDKKQVVTTKYDEAFSTNINVQFGAQGQQNLLNRVASVFYYENYNPADIANYNYATHYSYDIHGNVHTLINEQPDLEVLNQNFKKLEYQYDLISGKVKEVAYQKGMWDEYFHRYYYDDDNRVTSVETSSDYYQWTTQAKYFYYLHGPLARVEIGENQVYGADYAYTINGWLKTVNGDHLLADKEMGKDGHNTVNNNNRYFAQDVFGFSLTYFAGDYSPIGGAAVNPTASQQNLTDLLVKSPDLFNGNIARMVTAINLPQDGANDGFKIHINGYKYDQLNRIKQKYTVENDIANTSLTTNYAFSNSVSAQMSYKTDYAYDLNGNITNLNRRDQSAVHFDRLGYNYTKNIQGQLVNNKLRFVNDQVAANTLSTDIDDQEEANYNYDLTGQLVEDNQEEIDHIQWSVSGKIKEIIRKSTSNKPDLEFAYDPMGVRILKIVKPKIAGEIAPESQWEYTYYVPDGQGNIMAVYERQKEEATSGLYEIQDKITFAETHIYGSSRIGVVKQNSTKQKGYNAVTTNHVANYQHKSDDNTSYTASRSYTTIAPDNAIYTQVVLEKAATNIHHKTHGKTCFEIANHLGNIVATISDRKKANQSLVNTQLVTHYSPQIQNAQDYFPFGMTMPGRSVQDLNNEYRYGFQNQETDKELWDGAVSYKYRIEDPRLGRFFSVDPLAPKYPHNSTYAFSENRVIDGVELEGLEYEDATGKALGPIKPGGTSWQGARLEENFINEGHPNPEDDVDMSGVLDEVVITAMSTPRVTHYSDQEIQMILASVLMEDAESTYFASGGQIDSKNIAFRRETLTQRPKGSNLTRTEQAYVGSITAGAEVYSWIVPTNALLKTKYLAGLCKLAAKQGSKIEVAAKGVSVIGPRATYRQFAKDIGAKFLNVTDDAWTWAKNEEFLAGVVKRGDDVVFAGKFNPAKLDPNSVLAREIKYLTERGYQWTDDFSKLIKQ